LSDPIGGLPPLAYTADADSDVNLTNGVNRVANVNADLNGVVFEIMVTAGDDVAEGDELLILESMKMEIPVVAPVGGTVASVDVAAGASVMRGQLLVTLR
jgi:biotin carboxyl carrier protein